MEHICEDNHVGKGIPFKVVDVTREHRKGVVASCLLELVVRAREKLSVPDHLPVKVVLEQDGTEVDDNEYFGTLERNTMLMLLVDAERWHAPGKIHRLRGAASDDVDGSGGRSRELENLVGRLQGDLSHISMLGGKELELLSNMDPESLTDIIPDSRIFLVQLKEASGRFLSEKRDAQDALDLLKLYHNAQLDCIVPEGEEEMEDERERV